MTWAVIALTFLGFAIFSKGFRKVLGATLVVAIVVGFGIYVYAKNAERIAQQEEARAKQRIPWADVDVFDMKMGTESAFSTITGRVRNRNAQHTLTGLGLRLTIRECNPAGQCDVVGETTETMALSVPPGQARDINDTVYFRDLGKSTHNRNWSFTIVSVSGR